ncbi:ABC transporter ATP-binding protein [Paenibacillus sp. 19GGS1-52]|uniref:ABC transporter ATP-binding protein n=1 Tax=Paenibacillus sp. 19GGS1-52 TaxID=2758563 RepID=UPI001EFB100B|nr:ABC transporter ATP-binding protein [Paenibacillus sp. 19GGS1-52]ULO05091.1 ABC transporter ATP-binding protein [Paenibacillus sp. 19GGS1-52]
MNLLRVEGLFKQFGEITAVNRINFQIEKGRCMALLGPNGAGKTTTLKMLCGLIKPNEGTIQFSEMNGVDLRQYIGYMPQYPVFYNWMSGREFINYVGSLAHMNRADLKVRTPELLELVGLKDALNRKIGGYSGGMKQRLGLAQAMIHSPKLLMLDEPVSALDPIGRREVLDMMQMIKKETTILFSTHVLHDAEEISDDVVIMRGGEIVLDGSLSNILERNQKPIIKIQAECSLETWASDWKDNDLVEMIENIDGGYQFTVRDIHKAKEQIFADLANKKIPVLKFEVAQTSLEDLFMKVVQR